MARTAKLTRSHTVQMSEEWSDRLSAVADHPRIADSIASVIRDCIQASLPGFELELGLVELEEAGLVTQQAAAMTGGLSPIDLARLAGVEIAPAAPVKEDRSAGCFGGPPLPASRVG